MALADEIRGVRRVAAVAETPTGLEWETLKRRVGVLWRTRHFDTTQIASIQRLPEHVIYNALAQYREEVRNGLH